MVNPAAGIDGLRRAARRRLPKILFDWLEGGTDGEALLERNLAQFAGYALVPRCLVDVSARDPSCALFGRRYASPFGVAPTGFAGLLRPDADLLLARAAAARGVPFVLSGASIASIERVAAAAPGRTWFQLYAARRPEVSRDLMRRARAAGVETLVVTVDCPVEAKRNRDLRNGFHLPLRLTPRLILDGLLHLPWTLRYLRSGGTPLVESWAPYARPGATAAEVAAYMHAQFFCTQTWDDLARYRQEWAGNLVVKGVLHPEDAARAEALGADGVVVSNHGGRQLDSAPTACEALPGIVAAVGPGTAVMADGGFRRGSDVLIALGLGARLVFVGRPTLYGVAAAGLPGATAAIGTLQDEIARVMGQIGCNRLDELAGAVRPLPAGAERAGPPRKGADGREAAAYHRALASGA